MKVVAVIGDSDAGKTTLVERLVPRLGERGRVATVKSIHHDVEVDEPDSDTHRHRTAGAGKAVGITPSLTFAIEPGGKADHVADWPALRRVLRRLEAEGFDYGLVEGFTASPVPKIVVCGPTAEVAGPVVAHVDDAADVDVDGLADELTGLQAWRVAVDGAGT